MIDIHPTLMCRICLEDGAIYPIFESNDEFESIYTKLAVCIKEKLENIPGYPTNICLKCKNTSDTICNFISKFEETCSKLDSEIPKVKTEYLESLSDLDDDESAAYELQIDNMVLDKPKVEIKDPTELLEPLKHLTVKRIKLQNDASETRNSVDDKDVKRKKPKPRKTVAQNSAKNNKHATKSASKLTARKKKIAKPSGAANNNGVTKTAINSKTAKNFKNVEIQRKEDNNETTLSISYALCHLCGETFKDKDLLKRHTLKMHTERKFRCSKCHKAFLTTEILKEHQKCHENDIRSHICKTCGSGFYNKKGLNSHLRSVHTEKKPKPTYKCRFCEKTYSYRRGIVVHERSEHTGERPEVCSVCDRRFYDKVYLAEHMRIHSGHTPYKCPICSRGFTQCSNMKSHMHHNHRIKDLSPELLAKMKPNYLKILKPLSKIKAISKQKEEDQNENVMTQRLCDVCGSIFKSLDRLAYHKKYTHGEKKHKCNKCSKAYVSETQLKNHILKQHEKVTTVVCDLCGKRFFSKYNLKVHIDTVHRKTRKCTIHKCEFCEKTFKYKRGAIIHERAVHTGERPATCDVCGSSFYDDVYLREHMRIHTGDTPYKCPVCARGYAQRGNMKSHMRNHKISELTPDTLAKIKPNYFKFMRP